MFDRLFKPRPAKTAGEALYAAAARQARSPGFYAVMGVPDTREGRFELYSLHVILLLDRLKGQGPQADETAQILIETYVRGLDDAFREMGVGDTAVAKRVKKLAEAFYGRAKALQSAFDALPAKSELADVLARTVFEAGPGDVDGLVDYLAEVRDGLSRHPTEQLLAGDVAWGGPSVTDQTPWSETIRFSDLARGPVQRRLEADEATRKAIAKHLALVSLESLTAEVTAKPWLDGAEIVGRFRADITQTCSATAEAFADKVDGELFVRVLPPGSPNAPQEDLGEEIDLDPEADDPPDVLEGDRIDLAGYVVEHLSLELDPFPRKPGAVFEPPAVTEEASPFAVLRLLKKDEAPE